MTGEILTGWHDFVASRDPAELHRLLADDATFRSPVVHTPQVGRDRTAAYLLAAMEVFGEAGLTYVHELVGEDRLVLEFTAELDGTHVNGVDVIDVRDGLISTFSVFVRPLQGIDALHRRMAAMLEQQAAARGEG